MLSFLSKAYILAISFKLHASLTEFCYKCDGFCTTPPQVQLCNISIDKNPVCVVKKDTVEKTETRSCLYPSTDDEDIFECNEEDDGICKTCEGNLCNVAVKRKTKGPSRCYYCREECKNPLQTTDCYYLQSACLTVMKSVQTQGGTKISIYRECKEIKGNTTVKEACDLYKNSAEYNCTVCDNSSMCNRLPYDPPDPTPKPQLTADANVLECSRILFEFAIYILTFIVK